MAFQTLIKGAAMGLAEVIPGVSGGTIAFVTGIYERLLAAIGSFGPSLFKLFKEEGIKAVFKKIDGLFLLQLFAGMVIGIGIGLFGVTHLLETYPPIVWGFFFGLIISSAVYIFKQITRWSLISIIGLIVGFVLAYWITIAAPAEGSQSYIYIFISGMIAISALILPGISGSFILLLMGMYTFILSDTLKGLIKSFSMDKLMTMVVFALGCLTGLLTISKLLSWTFKKFRNATLAVLTGFMIGSLNKIWPWRVATDWLRDSAGEVIMKDGLPKKILSEMNVLPQVYAADLSLSPYTIWTIVFIVIGFLTVFILAKYEKN